MKCRAACRLAKERCWWWTRRRAWRRKRSLTPTWRCSHNLEIIPVINKIDLPSAEPERIREQIEQVIGLPAQDALLVSAKQGIGIKDVLEAVVHLVPAATGLARCAVARFNFRFLVRSLPRRDHSRASGGRHAARGAEDQVDGQRRAVRSGRPRLSIAQADPVR